MAASAPFCGPNTALAPFSPQERVVDIAHCHEGHLQNGGVKAVHPDMGDFRKRFPHRDKGPSGRIQEHRAQRGGSACAAIVGGAAAQPQHDPLCAAVQGMGYELPDAVGGGRFGVPLPPHQGKPCRRRHLHHRRPVRQHPVKAVHIPAVRPAAAQGDALPAYGSQEGRPPSPRRRPPPVSRRSPRRCPAPVSPPPRSRRSPPRKGSP